MASKRKREEDSDLDTSRATTAAPPAKKAKVSDSSSKLEAAKALAARVPAAFAANGAAVAKRLARKARGDLKDESRKGEAVRRGKRAQSPPKELKAAAGAAAKKKKTAGKAASTTAAARRAPSLSPERDLLASEPAPKRAAGAQPAWVDVEFGSASSSSASGDANQAGVEPLSENDAALVEAAAHVGRKSHKPSGSVRSTGSVRGVIYLGHIPYGFFEQPMTKFFSQFGVVKRLRLARSKRTGNSKGYAFIEFEDDGVARIVAEAMDGYLMYERRLVCKFVPPEKVHAETFRGAGRKWHASRANIIDNARNRAPMTPSRRAKLAKKLIATDAKKRAKLAALGIDYSFAGYGGAGAAQSTGGSSTSAHVTGARASASSDAAPGKSARAAVARAGANSDAEAPAPGKGSNNKPVKKAKKAGVPL